MTIAQSVIRVEGFNDRLNLLLGLKLPIEPDYIEYVRSQSDAEQRRRLPIRTKTQLWDAVQWAEALPATSRASWEKNTDRRSIAFLTGIERVFPELPRGAISAPVFADFEAAVAETVQAVRRWQTAATYYANHRSTLERAAKHYYHDVDGTPDLPLVGKPEWLLKSPMPLTPGVDVRGYEECPRKGPSPRLTGMKTGFVHLKAGMQDTSSQPHNGLSYRVREITGDGRGLTFDLGPAWYFDYVNELEALGAELADHLTNYGGAPPPAPLPLRGAPEAIFDLGNRSAVAGVNCLLIAKNYFKGEFTDDPRRFTHRFFTHLRRKKVLEAQNTVHVVPAGTHQPLGTATPEDRSVWMTAFRELCEEVFGVREAVHRKALDVDFMDLPEVRDLETALLKGTAKDPEPAARFYLLGVGLDPVTTKPEILVAIVVDWREAARRWPREDTAFSHKFNEEGAASPQRLSREALWTWAVNPPEKIEGVDEPASTLPAGAACMLLAAQADTYRTLTGLEA